MNDTEFMTIAGMFAKLATLAIFVERGLAYIFENELFVRLTTIQDPTSESAQPKRISKFPGLKSVIALIVSILICKVYDFNILDSIFSQGAIGAKGFGIIITGIVASGGSAGVMSIFQSYLGLNKEYRDAVLAAKIAQAKSEKEIAETNAQIAKMKLNEAKA